jgi:hypothetical protein
MNYITEDAAYAQMQNFADSIRHNFNVEDCAVYKEKTAETVWLGLQMKKFGKTYIAKMLYVVNDTGGLTLQNKWWVLVDREKEIAKLPSLREVFHHLLIKNY